MTRTLGLGRAQIKRCGDDARGALGGKRGRHGCRCDQARDAGGRLGRGTCFSSRRYGISICKQSVMVMVMLGLYDVCMVVVLAG